MKRVSLLILLFLLLTGCRTASLHHTSIDWVDFIMWNGNQYDGIHSGILSDDTYIGEVIGYVAFTVADNVSDVNYKIKDGDAAFHEKGTDIFTINGHPHFIAVKDAYEVNGYRVYYSLDDLKYEWHFKDVPIDKVKKLEIYDVQYPNKQKRNVLIGDEVKPFLELLLSSKEDTTFHPDMTTGDPLYYEMILYTNGPIAYQFGFHFDGTTYFWHPWDTSIISNEIEEFMSRD